MKYLLHFLINLLLFIWLVCGLYAQQGFVSFGGETTGSNGSLSISGGQIDFEYYFSAQGSLSLGLQHSWAEMTGIPPVLEIPSTVVASGQSSCFNASQTISVAGDGKMFIVQNGGHASIIAGQNIFLKPGTFVQPGGSLHAYISTQYCDEPESMLSSVEEEYYPDIQGTQIERGNVFFTIYPNPTSGNLKLEITDNIEFSSVQIEIYSAWGNLIFETLEPPEAQFNLSIAGVPPGIYLIRVLRDQEFGIKKIIKY